MTNALRVQHVLFIGTASLFIALTLSGIDIPLTWQVVVLTVFVAVTGLPHGALDPLVAHRSGLWRGVGGFVLFIAVYILLAGVTLLLWLQYPALSLLVFLALSAWHFGNDWRGELDQPGLAAAGLAIIALPALFHHDDVANLLALLTSPESAANLVLALAILAPIALLVAAASLLRSTGFTSRVGRELLVITCSAAVLPPLMYFVVYFCAQHSPRHLIRLSTGIGSAKILATGSLFTLLTIAAAVVVYRWIPEGNWDEQLIRVVFIGLAVLTVPHMILIELSERRKPTAISI